MDGSAEKKITEQNEPRQETAEASVSVMPETFNSGFIIERAMEVCMNPSTCWPKLRAETATPKSMYLGYIAYLAAVPIVCEFLRMITIGRSVPLIGAYHWPIAAGLIFSLTQYAMSLVMVGIVAFISQKLAQGYFGGKTDLTSTLKLVAYAATPAWLLGLFNLIPFLSLLALVGGLYGLYLFYKGIPAMTGVRAEKRAGYMAATVVCSFLCGLVIGLVAAFFNPTVPMPEVGGSNLDLPAGVSVDMEKFQKTITELEKMAPAKE